MKLHLLSLFLLSCITLVAQNEEQEKEARILYEEGITLLQKRPSKVFNKVQALGKFIQSEKQLRPRKENHSDLYKKSQGQIRELSNFFIQFQNSDSILSLTRFFPDSIFQRNTSYATPLKSLFTGYLDLKRSTSINQFFKIGDLYLPPGMAQGNTRRSIINFDNYWSLEVREFEKWLQGEENRLRYYPKKAKDEMLFLLLRNKLNTLKIEVDSSSYELSQSFFRDRIERAEEATKIIQEDYAQLKFIGFGILGVLLILGYIFWKKNDQLLKRNNQLLLEEKKRSEDLLLNMLPAEVVRQLKQKGAVKAHRYKAVSVLFSDFINFSQIAETLSPEELVGELNYCFTVFDTIIDKYHLQKIKTIGDAYMCVGGLYTRGDKHVYRMVAAALEIQQFLQNRKNIASKTTGYFSEARIGIHTGQIVAGVISTKKIAFDVWGDAVNVAQQMEQHSEKGKVNISGDTFHLIKDKFECSYRGKVLIKNKKEYDMYFVNGVIE